MASTNWVPEAEAMDSGFALDNLLRTQRAENARQAQSLVAGAQQTNQQHQNRLQEMLYGDQLKTQAADREAERAAPFLRTLISGNPQVAKTFGFGQNVTTPGELAVPEAGYAGTPDKTSFQPRTPTIAEASGIAKAVPSITQSLLQRQLDPNAQFTLGPGQVRFDAQGTQIAEGPKKPGAYSTYNEALLASMQQQQLNDASGLPKLRPTIDQDAQGNYQIKWSPADPLNPVDPIKQAYEDDLKAGVPKAQALENYLQRQGRAAGIKAQQTQLMTPFNEEAKKRMDTANMAITSAYRLMTYTPKERETFTGAGRLGFEAARLAQEAGLPTPGYTKEQVDRYSEFKKDNGMIEQYKFAIGGKQLTQGEQRVVEAFIPTGRELTTSEYEAKLRAMAGVMEAAQVVDQYLSVTGKQDVSPAQVRDLFIKELNRRGIDPSKSKDSQVDGQMPSGARLRSKYQ